MGAFMNAAEMSRLMMSHCLKMDFRSNVLNDVGDGVAAKVSTAGLLMVWLKPFATNLAFNDGPSCDGLVIDDPLGLDDLLELFRCEGR